MHEQSPSPVVAIDDLVERAPAELFVLTMPGEPPEVELRRTPRGDLLAFGYTSLELLAAACGPGQPWVRVSAAELERTADAVGITLFALDASLPDGHRFPEPREREQPELPSAGEPQIDGGLLYLPSRPFSHGDFDAVLELQADARGRLQLLVYTSRAELEEGCGPHQAWVAVPASALAEIAEWVGAYQVLFNPVLTEETRHTAPVVNWTPR